MIHRQYDFTHRVLIVAGITILVILLLTLLWQATEALLVIFAGVLLAVFLRALTNGLNRFINISDGWSLAVVVIVLVAIIGLGSWFMADRIMDQIGQLRQTLPASIDQIEQRVRQTEIGSFLLSQRPDGGLLEEGGILTGSGMWSRALGLLSSLFGLLASVVIILFVGLYLAAEPDTYSRGIALLIAPGQRERVERVLNRLGYMLQWWLLGQGVSMICVAALLALGLWLLDIPLALTLGLIGGIMEFIPRFGPIIGAVPAVLIALDQNPQQVIWVVVLYAAVQMLESYVILPLVQRQAVDLPPALMITTMFLMGILFGFIGLLLAAPLTVVIVSLVKQLRVPEEQKEVNGET